MYQGKNTIMRANLFLITALPSSGATTSFSQAASGRPTNFQENTRQARSQQQFATHTAAGAPGAAESSKRFNLTFNGGTPAEFIEAINDQGDLNVNVIIRREDANERLPPLEVRDVTVPQVFEAVSMANSKPISIVVGYRMTGGVPQAMTQQFVTEQVFRTGDRRPSESSIWYFYVNRPPEIPKEKLAIPTNVQIYQLVYLLDNYSIGDITTAIKTAWELMESPITPEIMYHEETKLLVARGLESHFQIIDTIIVQLERGADARNGTQVPAPGRTGQPVHLNRIPEKFDTRP